MAYTLADFVKLNPIYQKRYDPNTSTSYVKNTKTGKEVSFGVGQGQQYGIGALQNGSQIIEDPNKLISSLSQPQYQSPYSEKITGTLSAISNRPAFSYDPSNDTGLQAAQNAATDAVSRAAARRGMLYSDSNKSQMGQAAMALVPQFEQAAYNRYRQEGDDLFNQLGYLSNLENQSYGQYRDTIGDERYDKEFDYQIGRDRVADERAELATQLQRISTLGYVDERASSVLGMPVGTISPEERQAAADRALQLQMSREGNAAAMARLNASNAADLQRLKMSNEADTINQMRSHEFDMARLKESNKADMEKFELSRTPTDYDYKQMALQLAMEDMRWQAATAAEKQGIVSEYLGMLQGNKYSDEELMELLK